MDTSSASVRNTKHCINCGAEIDINAVMCPKCGVMQKPSTNLKERWAKQPSLGFGKNKNELPKSIVKVMTSCGLSTEDIIFSAKGRNGEVILTDKVVVIGREGIWQKMMSGSYTKGNKIIHYKSITGVQFKEPGMMEGYIQFTIPGGIESKGGVFSASHDENTVTISPFSKSQLNDFRKIRDIVEEKIHATNIAAPQFVSTLSIADELNKLAALKKDGSITDEEYAQLKGQLISKKIN